MKFYVSSIVLLLIHMARRCASDDEKASLKASMQAIWAINKSGMPLNVGRLREDTAEMFNHGFQNYLRVAWPHDNLLPSSCKGQDWQGEEINSEGFQTNCHGLTLLYSLTHPILQVAWH